MAIIAMTISRNSDPDPNLSDVNLEKLILSLPTCGVAWPNRSLIHKIIPDSPSILDTHSLVRSMKPPENIMRRKGRSEEKSESMITWDLTRGRHPTKVDCLFTSSTLIKTSDII